MCLRVQRHMLISGVCKSTPHTQDAEKYEKQPQGDNRIQRGCSFYSVADQRRIRSNPTLSQRFLLTKEVRLLTLLL